MQVCLCPANSVDVAYFGNSQLAVMTAAHKGALVSLTFVGKPVDLSVSVLDQNPALQTMLVSEYMCTC